MEETEDVSVEEPDAEEVPMDFTLRDIEGGEVVLSELQDKGKNVILVFWTTWCPHCVQAIPAIEDFYEEHGEEVSLISVNIREEKGLVRRFAADREISYRIALDRDGSLARSFNIAGVPAFKVIAPSGEILYSGHSFDRAVREAGF